MAKVRTDNPGLSDADLMVKVSDRVRQAEDKRKGQAIAEAQRFPYHMVGDELRRFPLPQAVGPIQPPPVLQYVPPNYHACGHLHLDSLFNFFTFNIPSIPSNPATTLMLFNHNYIIHKSSLAIWLHHVRVVTCIIHLIIYVRPRAVDALWNLLPGNPLRWNRFGAGQANQPAQRAHHPAPLQAIPHLPDALDNPRPAQAHDVEAQIRAHRALEDQAHLMRIRLMQRMNMDNMLHERRMEAQQAQDAAQDQARAQAIQVQEALEAQREALRARMAAHQAQMAERQRKRVHAARARRR